MPIERSHGSTLITDFSNHWSRAFSVVIPRLSVMLPCLMRPGRRCTNVLIPPSGYSMTSTCDENPLTWVKKPSCSDSTGIDTWKNFACVIGGLASVTLAGPADIGGSLRVVDDQVAHLLALGEQVPLEAVEEVLVELFALVRLVLGTRRVRGAGGMRRAGGGRARVGAGCLRARVGDLA